MTLDRRLESLHTSIEGKLKAHRGHSFFVLHPAWGYFAEAYGLTQVAIEIEGKDPTDRELTELQEAAKRAGAKVIFVQSQRRGKSAAAVADAIGARVAMLDPLAGDVEENLRRIASALADSFE